MNDTRISKMGWQDAPNEADLRRMARLACNRVGATFALLALDGGDRVVIVRAEGPLDATASDRQQALLQARCFGRHVIETGEALCVEDARAAYLLPGEATTAANGETIAFLGMPLVTEQGRVLGAICVVEDGARQWTRTDKDTLGDLAARTIGDLRRQAAIAALRAFDHRHAVSACVFQTSLHIGAPRPMATLAVSRA